MAKFYVPPMPNLSTLVQHVLQNRAPQEGAHTCQRMSTSWCLFNYPIPFVAVICSRSCRTD